MDKQEVYNPHYHPKGWNILCSECWEVEKEDNERCLHCDRRIVAYPNCGQNRCPLDEIIMFNTGVENIAGVENIVGISPQITISNPLILNNGSKSIDVFGLLEEFQDKLNHLESRLTKVENGNKSKRLLRPSY
jgi:hypothetical protein